MIDTAQDVLDNYWVLLPVKVLAILVIFLTFPLVVGYMEHKVLAHMQARLGPMEAVAFHGWAQLVADGVKFIQKEDVIPAAADRTVFSLAPAVALIPYIVTLVVLPFGSDISVPGIGCGWPPGCHSNSRPVMPAGTPGVFLKVWSRILVVTNPPSARRATLLWYPSCCRRTHPFHVSAGAAPRRSRS